MWGPLQEQLQCRRQALHSGGWLKAPRRAVTRPSFSPLVALYRERNRDSAQVSASPEESCTRENRHWRYQLASQALGADMALTCPAAAPLASGGVAAKMSSSSANMSTSTLRRMPTRLASSPSFTASPMPVLLPAAACRGGQARSRSKGQHGHVGGGQETQSSGQVDIQVQAAAARLPGGHVRDLVFMAGCPCSDTPAWW